MTIPDHITHVLFDMDDVMVRTRELDRIVKSDIFHDLGLTWDEHILPVTHLAMKQLVPTLFHTQHVDADVETYIQKYYAEYNSRLEGHCATHAVEGIQTFVSTCAARYTLGLVTSSTRTQADIITNALGIHNHFNTFITSENITRSKPDPEPYAKGMAALRTSGEKCMVVEDLPTGIASAKAADPKTFVLAITTTTARDQLTQADAIIDSYSEITFHETYE